MPSMRAVVQDEFGGPEVLRLVTDAPVPQPIPTEVQVRVSCVGVNPVDGKTREGASVAPFMGGFPMTVGWDVAGTVAALGTGVSRFAVGDRVYGMPRFPYSAAGYAEYVTAPSRHLVRIPEALDMATAASIPLPATTAYQIVHDVAQVHAGQTVLVLGAGGMVGSLVVQLAKKLGATVIGHATGEKLRRLERFGTDRGTIRGIDRGIDYAHQQFDDPHLPGGPVRDVDVVVDLIGGEFALRAVPLVRRGGIVVGVPSGQQQGLKEAAAKAGVRGTNMIVEPDHVALEYVSAMIADGELDVQTPATAHLEDVIDVHRRLADGRLPKTVLRVGPNGRSADMARSADVLFRAAAADDPVPPLPEDLAPTSRAEAYEAQRYLAERTGQPTLGWKIAATSAAGQRHINVDGPVAGRVLADRVYDENATVPLTGNRMCLAEPEFVFVMGETLPPRPAPYSAREVAEAVSSLRLGIELPSTRFLDVTAVGAHQLIADNACGHDFVLGPTAHDGWKDRQLADVSMTATITGPSGERTVDGVGANVLGDPWSALMWFVNELSAVGITIESGSFVTTGTCSEPIPVQPGDALHAAFDGLGVVSCTFSE